MINLERLEQAIAIMRRAGIVKMSDWQSGEPLKTESEIHTCGTAACFAGWIAVSPEFKAAGGKVRPVSGAPVFCGWVGVQAILDWLEAQDTKAYILKLLIIGEGSVPDSTVEWLRSKNIQAESEKLEPDSDRTYAELPNWRNYKADDVIKILEALRD